MDPLLLQIMKKKKIQDKRAMEVQKIQHSSQLDYSIDVDIL